MSIHVELEQQPAQPAVAICVHAAAQDLPRIFGESYGALMQYLGQLGEQPAGLPYAAYYNLNMQDLQIEIGFPVARPLPGEGPIQASMLPGGLWAKVLAAGPYDQLAATYAALTAWIAEHGYTPTGVAYEAYCSEPGTPPADIRTWIMFPLQAVTAPVA